MQNEGPEPRDMKLDIGAYRDSSCITWIAKIKEEKLNAKYQGTFYETEAIGYNSKGISMG